MVTFGDLYKASLFGRMKSAASATAGQMMKEVVFIRISSLVINLRPRLLVVDNY
jgi:hypothetical protein